MKFSLENPFFLLILIPAAAIFWWLTKSTHASLSKDQIEQSLILRILAAVFLTLALSGAILTVDSQDQTIVYLIDVSKSISPQERSNEFDIVRSAMKAKPSRDYVAVIVFASSPVLVQRPSRSPQPIEDSVPVDDTSTDIGAAIRLAKSVMPASGPRRIVILSDGNETVGSAENEVMNSDIQVNAIDTAKFFEQSQPEVSLASVNLPPSVHEDEPVYANVVISSSVEQDAKITVDNATVKSFTVTVKLTKGKNLVNIPIRLQGSGLQEVKFSVDALNDTILENNSSSAMIRVIGKPRVLYITDSPETTAPTIQAAMAKQSITLDLRSPTNLPTSPSGFLGYDSIVLSDIPASEITIEQQNAIQTAVGDFGVGLGMTGGIRSFIGGGWAGTPIEAALPVLMRPRVGTSLPKADIVVVLDQSGSMGLEEDGIQKVKLGALAAVNLMSTLQQQDRVAVIAVTTTPTLVVPFSSPKEAVAAKKDVESLEAGGGGIYCYVGLVAAYNLLGSSTAQIKHVIICPDTNDSEQQENCVHLAEQMRVDNHITTSVCGIGDWHDHDVGFQQSLAAAGGGQLYVVSRATELPQFFQRDLNHFETPSFVEGNFQPSFDTSDVLIHGIDTNHAPALLGYNIVSPRQDSVIGIRNKSKPDLMFAHRTYGLGRTFAFTSDETNLWAKNWLPWPGYTQFWTQTLRWSLRSQLPPDFDAFIQSDSQGHGHIVVDAFSADGGFINNAAFIATVAGPSSSINEVRLSQTSPGRYEGEFPTNELGGYLVSVHKAADSNRQAILGLSVPYPAEYATTDPNIAFLSRLSAQTGGGILESAVSVWKSRIGSAKANFPIVAVFLLIGTIVFILDIAWRRLGLRIRANKMVAPVVGVAQTVVQTASESINMVKQRSAVASATRNASPEATEKALIASKSDVLTRPVSKYMTDDDDPFPYVASIGDIRKRENVLDDDKAANKRNYNP